ncbi:hypothetical protein Q2336_25345, partial [Escherichia coli]|nr:hypothetical protein [Escherichia coli]
MAEIKISEIPVEQTTFEENDKQELSTETAPGIWETRFYTWSNLLAKVKAFIWTDVVTTVSV